MFTLGAWVVAESDVVFTPRGMHLIYICVHIFAAPLWCVGLANPKQFSVIYSFIDHRGTVWKCSKVKWNRVVSLQSDQQRTTNCVAWFDINSRVATVREKRGKNENFSRSGKSQGIFSKSGKIFDIVKVSELSGNSVFQFIVHKFSSRFKKCIFFWERWIVCCKASKAINYYLTLYALLMQHLWSLVFVVNAFF